MNECHLGVSSNRGTNIENCTLLQNRHFRPERGVCTPLDPPILSARLLKYRVKRYSESNELYVAGMIFWWHNHNLGATLM
jgi:hypothetical protein